jgi:DNA-binding transcriptional LysR family regulator
VIVINQLHELDSRTMKRHLPLFPSLRAFESAARHLGFKAAEEGLGIALGPRALINEKVALGRLVVVLDMEGAWALYFTLSCAKNWQRQPRILAFRAWLHNELGSCSGLDISPGKTTAGVSLSQ